MEKGSLFRITFLLLIYLTLNQTLQYNGWIETRKLFLFGPDNGFEFDNFGSTFTFQFQRQFDNVPRVGLAVYTIDFQYSPDFSCRITQATNKTSTAIQINSASGNINNRMYIMYIATDHQQMGVFVPERLFTDQLSLPTRNRNSQSFDFNFKEQISKLANNINEISLTVYLTGIATISQMTTNGFPSNRTSLQLKVTHNSRRFYTIQILIGQNYPYILIDWVECTVLYFIPSVLFNNRYQINSGLVTLKSYGGTRQPVSESINLLPLENVDKFQQLSFFFGISKIQCKNGASITLLGVQKYFTSVEDNTIKLLLQMQTWRLTFIQTSSFNFIQYKSLKCSQIGANCKEKCGDGNKPFYIIQNKCNYCQYSCLSCNVTNRTDFCDTCDQETRMINTLNNLCQCKSGYYDTFNSTKCQSCFPCGTCERKNTCLTCLENQNMMLNRVKSECECKPGYYPNYIVNTTTYTQSQPCLKCSPNCLYCFNSTSCMACKIGTYLTNGQCIPICNQKQQFIDNTNKCQSYSGDLFDQMGRLGFDWSYQFGQNQMIIDLVFSQPDLLYYYFQNGKGFNYQDNVRQQARGNRGPTNTNGGGDGSIFYDDGINSKGFQSAAGSAAAGVIGGADGAGGSGNGGAGDAGGAFGAIDPFMNQDFNNLVDQSALRGQFYGLGETAFIRQLYEKYNVNYRNQYGIPYGKYQLSQQKNQSFQQNFIDALSRNLVFKISNQTLPYTIDGVSNNRFTLRTRPTKTYINEFASISIKNPALVRLNQTALQTPTVQKPIERFDFYSGQQLSTARSIQDSNQFFIGALWGMCKYFLFVGFGWPFIPIMSTLQYIMGFNYIDTNIPLNLEYFLSSFKDFRNPSILFNPKRNDFDGEVLNHPNIYKQVPALEKFDRGLDFMKNSWQFFFVPILAVALLGLLYLLNMIFRKCCRKDFCMISKFLLPRAPLLIAAYTLIQALPVSFFFFSQLKDTTFHHPRQPNNLYPLFNTAMAYLAFFLTCAIPLLLLSWLYYHFNYQNRISKFSDGNLFNKKILTKIGNSSGQLSRAQLRDPLWGGDQSKIGTYILGIGLFFLAIVFGFFLAFFINNFAWQIVGLIFFSALFLAFILASTFFQDKIIKIFLIIILVLMVSYLFLHAGLGSNRSMGTFDKWNTGYFGIGLIYAMILTAVLFTGYLLYKFFKQAYLNHKKYGCWIDVDKEVQNDNDKQVERVQEYRRDTSLKSTFLKRNSLKAFQNGDIVSGGNQGLLNKMASLGNFNENQVNGNLNMNGNLGLAGNAGSLGNGFNLNNALGLGLVSGGKLGSNALNLGYNPRMASSNIISIPSHDDDNLQSDQRLISQHMKQNDNLEQLLYHKQDKARNETIFITKKSNMLYAFPSYNDRLYLLSRQPLYIDSENRIYDNNKSFIDYYFNLIKNQQVISNNNSNNNIEQNLIINNNSSSKQSINQQQNELILASNNVIKSVSNKSINIQKQIYVINGQQYELIKQLDNNQMLMRNLANDQMKTFDMKNFSQTSSKQIIYRSNSKISSQKNIQLQQFNIQSQNIISNKIIKLQKQGPRTYVNYQGLQYEELGRDDQGRHRLYNQKLKKYIMLTHDQYNNLINSSNMKKSGDNYLLVQSAVNNLRRSSFKNTTEIVQMQFVQQNENDYVFEGQNGNQIYINKKRINTDLPIELDSDGNIMQNGIIVLSREQTMQKSSSSNNNNKFNGWAVSRQSLSQNTISMPSATQLVNTNNNSIINTSKIQQQVQSQQVISPQNYYKIIGVLSDKVKNYQYKSNDVYLVERNIIGKDVMSRVAKIQGNYPHLAILVKGQTDQSQEYWLAE